MLLHLDVRGTKIDEASAMRLAAALPHLRQLQHLDVSDNFIGADGAAAIGAALAHLPQLLNLELGGGSDMGPAGMTQ